MSDTTDFQMSEALVEFYKTTHDSNPDVDDFSHILLKKDDEEIVIDYNNKREYIESIIERVKAEFAEENPEEFAKREESAEEMTDEDYNKFPINMVLSELDKAGEDVSMEFDQPAYIAACREFSKELKKARAMLRDELFAHYGLHEDDDDADLLWDEAFQVSPGKFEIIAEAFGRMVADTDMQRGDFETPVVEEEEEEEEPETEQENAG